MLLPPPPPPPPPLVLAGTQAVWSVLGSKPELHEQVPLFASAASVQVALGGQG